MSTRGGCICSFVALRVARAGTLISKGVSAGDWEVRGEVHVCSLNLGSRNCYEIIPRQVVCGGEGRGATESSFVRHSLYHINPVTPSVLTSVCVRVCLGVCVSLISSDVCDKECVCVFYGKIFLEMYGYILNYVYQCFLVTKIVYILSTPKVLECKLNLGLLQTH